MIPETSCMQCRESLIWYAAGQLTAAERDPIERHLATCADCRADLRQWRKAASSLTHDDDLPPDRDADTTWNQLLAQLPPSPQANRKIPVRGLTSMTFDSDDNDMIQTVTPIKTKGSPPRFRRAFLAPVATIVLVALSIAVFGIVLSHQHNNGTHPATNPTPLPATDPNHPSVIAPKPQNLHMPVPAGSTISSISMLTANDGWAAGYIPPTGGSPGQNTGASSIRSFFVHFHNGVWTLAPDSFPVGSIVDSLVMISPNEGWAVGYTDGTNGGTAFKPRVWHFTGGHWQLTTIPVLPEDGSISVDAIYAPTPDFVWISASPHYDVKNATVTQQQVFLAYHAGTWTKITAPAGSTGSLVSPDEGWAEQQAGGLKSSASTAHFLHYQHGTWTDVMQVSGQAESVKMLSAQDGWAMVQRTGTSVYYHFTGNTWQPVTLPSLQNLQEEDFFPIAPDEVWLVGWNAGSAKGNASSTTVTEFVNHNQAQVLPLPQPYDGVTQITTDGNGGSWAVVDHPVQHHPVQQGTLVPDAIVYDLHGVWTIYGIGG
jgi:Putative zinc-finger